MANTQLLSKYTGVSNARLLQERLDQRSYYIFGARHLSYTPSDSVTAPVSETVDTLCYSVYDQMLFGKRVDDDDISLMIADNRWVSNTVYQMYDDKAVGLFDSKFFVTTSSGTYLHVYKCIDNNGGAPSTAAPTEITANIFYTSDDYQWKYMFSIDQPTYNKFGTSRYIPLVANNQIAEAAVDGAIDAIKIENGGRGYDNYIVEGTFNSSDLRLGGNPLIYAITSEASSLNNFYENCVIKMQPLDSEEEDGGAAQYRRIVNYIVEGGQKKIFINSEFSPPPNENDTYDIYPSVDVFNTGDQSTTNCIARAIVSANTGNSITSIQIINPGSGYRSAIATIRPSSVINVSTNASLRAIISPPGGHGFDPATELVANKLCFSTIFDSSISSVLPTTNDFRTVGLIRDPYFTQVRLSTTASVGNLLVGETLEQYTSKLLANTINVTVANTTITGTSTSFEQQLEPGDRVLITNGATNTYGNVVSIANNTSFTLSTNAIFTSSDCELYYIRPVRFGKVESVATGSVILTDVSTAGLTSSNKYIGQTSYATIEIDNSVVNDKAANNFNSFVQLQRFVGNIVAGAIEEDQLLTQTSALVVNTPTAYVYAIDDDETNDVLLLSTVSNIFDANSTATTETGTFSIDYKYPGDLVRGSGQVLYVENFQPLTRNVSTTETIKLVLEL